MVLIRQNTTTRRGNCGNLIVLLLLVGMIKDNAEPWLPTAKWQKS